MCLRSTLTAPVAISSSLSLIERSSLIKLLGFRLGNWSNQEELTVSTLVSPIASNSETAVRELNHWINGTPTADTSGRFGDVFHPATGRLASRVPLATEAEVDAAVQAAAAAFPAWAAQPPLRSARVLFRFREIFEQRLDEVAALITNEHGKVNSDARGEATRGLEVVEFATGIP